MNIYVIGGRPCSGKTTFAYRLGKKSNIKVLYLDVFAHEEALKSSDESPELFKWKTKDMLDILQDKPSKLFIDYLNFYEELFPIFLDYIRTLQIEILIIESAMLLPKYVKILEESFNVKVVYLYTTDDFVKSVYPNRDYALDLVKRVNGEKALNHLLQRDILFSNHLYKSAEDYGYKIIKIDHESGFEEAYQEVEKVFDI